MPKRTRDKICKKNLMEAKTWDNHDENEDKLFKFIPALHVQRKRKVLDEVIKFISLEFPQINFQNSSMANKTLKLLDVGCERCAFFQYLQMELIGLPIKFDLDYIGLDIDEFLLVNQTIDTLRRNNIGTHYDVRNGKINVKLLAENVLEPSVVLDRPDVLVMIEVIEHLQTNEASYKLPNSIFGVICPKLVIITTPNADFNIVFGMESRLQFRHWDHKFEWDRNQFEQWCTSVIEQYPEYSYTIDFIGCAEEHSDKGGGSQMAIFQRNLPQPIIPSNQLIPLEQSCCVFDKPEFFSSMTIEEAIKRFLFNQMSSWGIEKTVFCPGENDSFDSSIEVQQSDDEDNNESNSFRIVYNEDDDSETMQIYLSTIQRIVRHNFSHVLSTHNFSVDIISLIKETCQSHKNFKFDEANNCISYVSCCTTNDSLDEIELDEESYYQQLNQLSNTFQNHFEL